MVLEILGTGCTKCKMLHEAVLKAVADSGVVADVRKVEDIALIMQAGVMSTPALVKDGKVLSAGKIPTPKEISAWLVA
jgi:small redox-active disulfide protein 2